MHACAMHGSAAAAPVIGVPYLWLLVFFLLPVPHRAARSASPRWRRCSFKDLITLQGRRAAADAEAVATTSSSPRTRCTSRPTWPA